VGGSRLRQRAAARKVRVDNRAYPLSLRIATEERATAGGTPMKNATAHHHFEGTGEQTEGWRATTRVCTSVRPAQRSCVAQMWRQQSL
jgi:hypothetical protein